MNAGTLRILLMGGFVAAAVWGGAKIVSAIRGIRNNNPGNIELGANWIGQVAPSAQTDARFVQFTTPEYGIRAIARILASYAARGIVTARQIAYTWAPPEENDSAAYASALAKSAGVAPDAPLSREQWPEIIAGIIRQENGVQPYDAATLQRGVAMA
jgi:hypothetical protein